MNCGTNRGWSVIYQALSRETHRSVLDPEHSTTVNGDIRYQVEARSLQIILLEEVQKLKPKHLKVSPMAVIPHNYRRGRSS